MFSCKILGLFCAIMASFLLAISMATNYWVNSEVINAGLWKCMSDQCKSSFETNVHFWNAVRAFMVLSVFLCFSGIISLTSCINRTCAAGVLFFFSTFCSVLALAVYLILINHFYKDLKVSWSYILGWFASITTFSAGIFSCCSCKRKS